MIKSTVLQSLNNISCMELLADTKLLDELSVALKILLLEVSKHAAALSNHHKKSSS